MKIFVTGIGTNVGKTIVTGIIGKEYLDKDKKTITMKIIQTGCNETISDDIKTHRKIMNIPLQKEDFIGLTCPYVFKFPSSPHLASKLENAEISIDKINNCISELEKFYNNIIIEGIGGIYVPINNEITVLDWLTKVKIPVILVTIPVLGSINHTLLSVETLLSKNILINKIYYNLYFRDNDIITNDTFNYLKNRYKNIEIEIIGKINL